MPGNASSLIGSDTTPDFFNPSTPQRKLTNSEYMDDFANRPYTYAQKAQDGFDYERWKLKYFKPTEQNEDTLSSIEHGLSDWGNDYSKRRAIEKKTAKYIRQKVVPTGLMLGAEIIAERLESCRNSGVLGIVGENRKIVLWENKCGLVKLCPDEARAEQKRLARQYVPACEAWLKGNHRRRFQYAVFEPVNVELGNLKDGIRDAYHQLRKMLRHESFANVAGCFTALECPLSRDGKSWNVHINCLFLIDGVFDWVVVRKEYGQRIHFKSTQEIIDTTKAYLKRRNGGRPVEASKADILTCAFGEIIKYSSKHVSAKGEAGKNDAPGITQWPPELFCEWYAAHKGLRRCRSYGVLYGAEKPEKEPLQVTWIGSMDFCPDSRRYSIQINGRPVISLQGDKSTKNRAQNRKQIPIFTEPPPNRKQHHVK